MTTHPVICASRHDGVKNLRLFFSLISICLLLEPLAAFAAVSDTAKVFTSGSEEPTCSETTQRVVERAVYSAQTTTASTSDVIASPPPTERPDGGRECKREERGEEPCAQRHLSDAVGAPASEKASIALPSERLNKIDVAMVKAIMNPATSGTAYSDKVAVVPGKQGETIVEAASSPLLKISAQPPAKLEANPDLDTSLSQSKNPSSEKISIGLPSTTILGGIEKNEIVQTSGPVVIDSDEITEKSSSEDKMLATDPNKTRVIVGARFPLVLASQVSSKTAKAGDLIEARLKNDLLIGERLIAEAGSTVIGHIDYSLKARTALRSLVSSERWYKNSGCLGITFDELINAKGDHLPLVVKPAQQERIIKNKGEGRLLGVNRDGQVVEPWSTQLQYKAMRIGVQAALVPAGFFSFGAVPVALGVLGAANPSIAFMKPVGLNVRHRRIKGFAMGFLSGVPGGIIIQDGVTKGQEAVIQPGDEFLAEFKQDFTGEPATETSLLTRASGTVQGQVLPKEKKTN